MQEISRSEFNRIAYNYEHVYYQVIKHIVLPPLSQCKFTFTVDDLISMFQGDVHCIKKNTIHLGDLTTFQKYSNITIAIECMAHKGDKELPWKEDRLPPKEFLLGILKILVPDHDIFSQNPPELLGVEEQQIKLKKETIDLLKQAAPLNPYRACIKKRSKEERKEIQLKKIQNKKLRAENALSFREKALDFKKQQIQELQRREQQQQNNQNNQNNLMDED